MYLGDDIMEYISEFIVEFKQYIMFRQVNKRIYQQTTETNLKKHKICCICQRTGVRGLHPIWRVWAHKTCVKAKLIHEYFLETSYGLHWEFLKNLKKQHIVGHNPYSGNSWAADFFCLDSRFGVIEDYTVSYHVQQTYNMTLEEKSNEIREQQQEIIREQENKQKQEQKRVKRKAKALESMAKRRKIVDQFIEDLKVQDTQRIDFMKKYVQEYFMKEQITNPYTQKVLKQKLKKANELPLPIPYENENKNNPKSNNKPRPKPDGSKGPRERKRNTIKHNK